MLHADTKWMTKVGKGGGEKVEIQMGRKRTHDNNKNQNQRTG